MREVSTSFLDRLNDIQRQAVTAKDGPVMVIAGPGSGKTRVLTFKVAYLIQQNVKPWEILCLTFTNKAAKEMKERIENLVGSGANRIWAGTFHSLFARMLRVDAHRIGFPNDFTIYDTDDSKSLINEIIKQMGLNTKVYNANAVRSRISAAKSNLVTPKRYVEDQSLMDIDRMNKRPQTFKIYEKYVQKCFRAGAMDFDDLLLKMFQLLYENPDNIREKYRNQFQYLLVDEFQDTNFLQYEIIKLLSRYEGSKNNICIVGDDAQSIYSFRGATIENILQFENDFPDLKTFKLEQNYRSTNHIVEAANGVISYNKRQIKKKIWTDEISENKIKIIKTLTDSEEGKRVADLIIEQKNRYNLENTQIAILYRTNYQSRVFEESLRRYNIPYRIYGGMSFYQRKEIKDMISYMRLTVNPRDDEAFKRVVNTPKRGIGKSTIDKLIQFSDDNEISLWESVPHISLSKRASSLLAEFAALIATFRKKMVEGNAYEIATLISKKSGIVGALKADNSLEGLNRLENVNALLDGIKEFVEDDVVQEGVDSLDKSLARYLQGIALITDQDNNDGNTDVVTLMSVHSAKGLEFTSVFVVGLEENLFPSYMSLSSPDQIDEERRLFYVAITRAEKYLTLTHSNSRYQYGNMRYNDPSRFIEEIPLENVDSIIPVNKEPSSSGGLGQPKLLGNFKQGVRRASASGIVIPKDFSPSEPHLIKAGMHILHAKFGNGKVISVDERFVATIEFDQVIDTPQKRIMLKYAKLQILS